MQWELDTWKKSDETPRVLPLESEWVSKWPKKGEEICGRGRRAKKPHKNSSSPSSFHFYLKQNLENKLSPACVTQVCNRAPRGLFAAVCVCVCGVICQLLTRKKIVKWKWWFLWFCSTYFKTLFWPFHLESCRVTGVHSWVFLVVKRSLLILIMLGRALLLMFRPA